MPIYLVRWPNLFVSIVRADNEQHLQQLLDEVDDPGRAIWEEYDGPLWFDLEPHTQEVEDGSGAVELDDYFYCSDSGPDDVHTPRIPAGVTGASMLWTICARVFPGLYSVLRSVEDLTDEDAKGMITIALRWEGWLAEAEESRPRLQVDPADPAIRGAELNGGIRLEGNLELEVAQLAQLAEMRRATTEWRATQYARLCDMRQLALADLGNFLGQRDSLDGPGDDLGDDLN